MLLNARLRHLVFCHLSLSLFALIFASPHQQSIVPLNFLSNNSFFTSSRFNSPTSATNFTHALSSVQFSPHSWFCFFAREVPNFLIPTFKAKVFLIPPIDCSFQSSYFLKSCSQTTQLCSSFPMHAMVTQSAVSCNTHYCS